MIPWIEPKPDILSGVQWDVCREINWIVKRLFQNAQPYDHDKFMSIFNENLLSAGSVHGNKQFSQKKQYYMDQLGKGTDVLSHLLRRQGDQYDYEFFAS